MLGGGIIDVGLYFDELGIEFEFYEFFEYVLKMFLFLEDAIDFGVCVGDWFEFIHVVFPDELELILVFGHDAL